MSARQMTKRFFLKAVVLSLLSLLAAQAHTQLFKVKNNLPYDLTKTPNIGIEVSWDKDWSLNIESGANFFLYSQDPMSALYRKTKWSHWVVQPELRYWTRKKQDYRKRYSEDELSAMTPEQHAELQEQDRVANEEGYSAGRRGWFVGAHAHIGQMNVSGINIPYPFLLQNRNNAMKHHRYEGWFFGAGVSLGYQWILSKRLTLEAVLGLGYAHIIYDKYRCINCGKHLGRGHADYIGPTKAALSLTYIINPGATPKKFQHYNHTNINS